MKLIGLTGIAENDSGQRIGSARVGKDEVGKFLGGVMGWGKTSFAAPMYKVVEHAFGIDLEILENLDHHAKEIQLYQPWNMTIREMLQTIGTELFRDNIDQDFWVKRCVTEIERLHAGGKNVVITDVRMPNEAQMIRDKGGIIVHIHRVTEAGKVRAHSSEQQVEILGGDLHIHNNGTLQELYDIIRSVVL